MVVSDVYYVGNTYYTLLYQTKCKLIGLSPFVLAPLLAPLL